MNDMPTPQDAYALLKARERALLAENRAYCLTCGAASQDGIMACLQTMNDCLNLHGFPGIPCTLEEQGDPSVSAMPVPTYPMGARVRFTPPVVNVPSAIPYRITGRIVEELCGVPPVVKYVLQPFEPTGHWAVDGPLIALEDQVAPWPEDPPPGEETSHAQSGKHDWVSGSTRVKTYGSAVHVVFQIFVDIFSCQRS